MPHETDSRPDSKSGGSHTYIRLLPQCCQPTPFFLFTFLSFSFSSFFPPYIFPFHTSLQLPAPLRPLHNDIYHTPIVKMKPIHDMPSLCTVVLSALWAEDDVPDDDEYSSNSAASSTASSWESQRQLDFLNYCHAIFSQLNVSCSVIYTRYIGSCKVLEGHELVVVILVVPKKKSEK